MSFEPSDRRNRFLYLRCHACRISACRLLGLRASTRLELDTFAMPWGVPEPNHRCRAWGVHAVGRVRRATGCAREMQVPSGGCPCSGGPKKRLSLGWQPKG